VVVHLCPFDGRASLHPLCLALRLSSCDRATSVSQIYLLERVLLWTSSFERRMYHATYYAASVFDPDDNNIQAVHHGREASGSQQDG
jgi:hypothetical protein